MQTPDKNIRDHPDGSAAGYYRQRYQSITEELLDFGASYRFEAGALPGFDGPDSSAPRSCAAPFLCSPQLPPNR